MSDFVIKSGDTLPVLTDTLSFIDGTFANLSGATVLFQMKSPNATTLTTNATATITNPSGGGVSYTFTPSDSATVGYYQAQWSVTFASGAEQTWPTQGYITVLVEPSVDNTSNANFNIPSSPALTVGYLIERTFDLLLGASREERNQLTNSLDNVTTTFNVNYPLGSLKQGTYLAIDDEVMYVWSSSPGSGSSSTVTVNRGDKGTTAVAHAANSIIQVNPYFTKYTVRKTLQDEIRSWGPQVFQVKTIDIPAVNFIRGYDMGSLGTWFSVLAVTETPDTELSSPVDNNTASFSYRVIQNADTSVFPSGNGLIVTDPLGIFDTPRNLHIVYSAPIDVDSTFDDNDYLYLMGMDNSDVDIPPYGAAWRLAASREVRRMLTEAQGAVGDLSNFPPGYQLKAAEEFKQLRDSRLGDAIARLRAQYPILRSA